MIAYFQEELKRIKDFQLLFAGSSFLNEIDDDPRLIIFPLPVNIFALVNKIEFQKLLSFVFGDSKHSDPYKMALFAISRVNYFLC